MSNFLTRIFINTDNIFIVAHNLTYTNKFRYQFKKNYRIQVSIWAQNNLSTKLEKMISSNTILKTNLSTKLKKSIQLPNIILNFIKIKILYNNF